MKKHWGFVEILTVIDTYDVTSLYICSTIVKEPTVMFIPMVW